MATKIQIGLYGAGERPEREESNETAPHLPLPTSLKRTLSVWEAVFYSFLGLLAVALLLDLWFLFHSGKMLS